MPLPSDLRAWTKTLVRHYDLRAGQRLGQHFLVDRRVLKDILRTAELKAGEPVLEVGGGLGVLTLGLLEQGARVAVVELDYQLVPGLRKLAAAGSRLTVVEGDILKIPDPVLRQALSLKATDGFAIVANLPYEISGAFLRRFLGSEWRLERLVLLLQREVGERLAAKPGQMSLLALLVQLACSKVEVVRLVPASAFWPQPRVESCLVRFRLRSQAERAVVLNDMTENEVWRLARFGFAARRKLLLSNIAGGLRQPRTMVAEAFKTAGLKPKARAQELALEDWVKLAGALDHINTKVQ